MNNSVIAKKLIDLRGDRTQAQIAKAIGVSPSAYSMYEVGQRIPRDEIKVRIARFYKKSVQSIFFNDEATNSERRETL